MNTLNIVLTPFRKFRNFRFFPRSENSVGSFTEGVVNYSVEVLRNILMVQEDCFGPGLAKRMVHGQYRTAPSTVMKVRG